MRLPLSIVILTKNEHLFIERCIRSVRWADEVVVVDSGSTDGTVELAESLGATVYARPWHGWARQRNIGIALARHDWTLYLDADDLVTPRLAASIQQVMASHPDPRDAYYVDRRPDSLGRLLANESRPMRRRGMIRLLNRQHNSFDETMKVHEECRPAGRALPLKGVLIHWRGFTVDESVTSLNKYAGIEAEVLGDRNVRVTGLRIVLRPLLRFMWCYVARLGILRGTPGLINAMMKATNEFVQNAKAWETQHVPVPILHPPDHLYHPVAATEPTHETAPVLPARSATA